ncbi:hypothetical protein F511_38254 [Dorcoceras hygrometricum]|uniref:Uncharacterized protein n=1 Tax=Dorcoceras hygrometricum TaxID=472368 RepID=A0A2Z7D5B8_9LAMI|nr:hypothetical protein F511_38254 [Dorcoceras hygrometricum]
MPARREREHGTRPLSGTPMRRRLEIAKTSPNLACIEDERQYRAPHLPGSLVISRYETSG